MSADFPALLRALSEALQHLHGEILAVERKFDPSLAGLAGMDRLDFHLDQELQHLVRSADSPRFAAGLDEFFARKGSPQGAGSAG